MKRVSSILGTLMAAALAGGNAVAQTFPAKPVRLVVAFATGGATDTFARVTAAEMSKSLGQQVIVENRPGAGATLAAEFVAKSAPDGYTLLFTDLSTHAINPSLYAKLAYHPSREFAKAVDSPKAKEIFTANAAEAMKMSPEAMQQFLESEIKTWADVVKATGVKLQ